jgi:D-glycero-D-manno-heptose 1,7-bisphosphate phosphatase
MIKLLLVDLDNTVRQPKSGGRFIQSPEDQEVIPGADSAIETWFKNGWTIIAVSNQGGVAAGYRSLDQCIAEQRYTLSLLTRIDRIYFCPDFEGEIAWCVDRSGTLKFVRSSFTYPDFPELLYQSFRKPGSGMLKLAIDNLDKYPDKIIMVGDRPEDREAAMNAGVEFIRAEDWWSPDETD